MTRVLPGLFGFLKKNSILCISFLLAAVSAFCVHPDSAYFGYINYRTLAILLSLMLVMAGLQALGLFSYVGEEILSRAGTTRSLALLFTLLCFFFSMLITNDVALITFIPFTIRVLTMADRKDLMIRVIVLETIASNLGSMLTPLGNPQNLYLYGVSGMSLGRFLLLMLPYSLLSLVLLLLFVRILTPKDPVSVVQLSESMDLHDERPKLILYACLFILSILTVVRILPYWLVLAVVVVCLLIHDRSILTKADYGLLFTFVFLFIFIGNMKRVPVIDGWLSQMVFSHELATAVVSSQVISNVPAAILLSEFTTNLKPLIVGVNIGGLGTLIASMASLISYKYYAADDGSNSKKYLGIFTLLNLLFLGVLLGFYMITK